MLRSTFSLKTVVEELALCTCTMMDIKNSFKVLILLLSLQFPQLFVCAVLKKSIRNSDLIHYDYTKIPLDPSPRIIGGSEAIARQYPWEVQLRDKRTGWLICGGSLVSDTSILTAGHCVHGKDEWPYLKE